MFRQIILPEDFHIIRNPGISFLIEFPEMNMAVNDHGSQNSVVNSH